jgi:hypothetical protein
MLLIDQQGQLTPTALTVSGRLKTSHSWALQNQPFLFGGCKPVLVFVPS